LLTETTNNAIFIGMDIYIPPGRKIKIKHINEEVSLAEKDRIRTALNLGIALASAEQELKLIMVKQVEYPLHLFGRFINEVLIFFKDGTFTTHSGAFETRARINIIGPKYNLIQWWSPIPLLKAQTATGKAEAYTMMQDLIQNTPNKFYEQIERSFLDESLGYIARRKVAV
jgi:hypothetical protein